MEKKLTNSGPLREPADKHSIYTIEIVAGAKSRRCNDNTCEESKNQNFHDSLWDLTFLTAAPDPEAPIYWQLISRQRPYMLLLTSPDRIASYTAYLDVSQNAH